MRLGKKVNSPPSMKSPLVFSQIRPALPEVFCVGNFRGYSQPTLKSPVRIGCKYSPRDLATAPHARKLILMIKQTDIAVGRATGWNQSGGNAEGKGVVCETANVHAVGCSRSGALDDRL